MLINYTFFLLFDLISSLITPNSRNKVKFPKYIISIYDLITAS